MFVWAVQSVYVGAAEVVEGFTQSPTRDAPVEVAWGSWKNGPATSRPALATSRWRTRLTPDAPCGCGGAQEAISLGASATTSLRMRLCVGTDLLAAASFTFHVE